MPAAGATFVNQPRTIPAFMLPPRSRAKTVLVVVTATCRTVWVCLLHRERSILCVRPAIKERWKISSGVGTVQAKARREQRPVETPAVEAHERQVAEVLV